MKPKQGTQVISRESAEIVTEMMINAVDNGEAKWAKPKGYRIKGKPALHKYRYQVTHDDKKTIASFVGFAPAD